MLFDHEKLDVYQVSLRFAAYAMGVAENLRGDFRSAKDQLIRASQSVPLNIAEGNGKRSPADRKRFFEIARGSAMECAAVLDVLVVCGACPAEKVEEGKRMLSRVVSMLTKMTERPPTGVREEATDYVESHDWG